MIKMFKSFKLIEWYEYCKLDICSMLGLNKIEFDIFVSLMWSLLPKDLTNQNLFIFIAAGVVPCGGRKAASRTSL